MKNRISQFKRKGVINILLFLFVQLSIAQNSKVDSILYNFNNHPEHILVAAHRGDHMNNPENSKAAIKETIKQNIDIIELDVRKTKDGKLIIMHDKTVDRTTNGKGNVNDYTWRKLKKLRLLFKGNSSKEKVPSLKKVFKLIKGKIMIDIDFKLDDVDAIKQTYKLIEKCNLENQIIFFLYDHHYIPELYNLNKNVKIMPRAHDSIEVEEILKYDYIKIMHIDDSFYSDSLMKKIRDRNIRIWSNSLREYDKMEEQNKNSGFEQLLEKKHINVIQTNLPEELLKFLKDKNKHE